MTDKRGVRSAVTPLPVGSGRVKYGVWDEHAGGFAFSAVREMRSKHPEQPTAGCEDCYADNGDNRS
ncbi:hypothetical protein GTY54_19885 [Streptomyces sp. SID625]|nr:hypothetical protein [Streptomyces sp. SID625]